MIIPTTYWGPTAWYDAWQSGDCAVEVMESFLKQTPRNRCTILAPDGSPIQLSVPVVKVEHKQLTRDVMVSNQQHWQHQHRMAILSAYKKTPFFDYYQDYVMPIYDREWRYLIDLNQACHDVVVALLKNEMPSKHYPLTLTKDWCGQPPVEPWGNGISILDTLFKKGPYPS